MRNSVAHVVVSALLGAILVVLQFVELTPAHAGREFVGIERWRTHQRQDFAVVRIDGHNCAPFTREGLRCNSLQIEVEREVQVVSGRWRFSFQ